MATAFHKQVIVKLLYEGLHSWLDVSIPRVHYLMHPHRHQFHITCYKTVTHNNRQVEVISFKQDIFAHLNNTFDGNFKNMSCEDIAEHLCTVFELSRCEVLEDGENGAVAYRAAQQEPQELTLSAILKAARRLPKSTKQSDRAISYIYVNKKSRLNGQVYSVQFTSKGVAVLTPIKTLFQNNKTSAVVKMPKKIFERAVANGHYKPLKTKQ